MDPYTPVLLDPKLTPSRIFVKNLPTTGLSRLELHEHFSQFGKVLGINYQSDFAFIQFDSPSQADHAVRAQHMTYYKGQVIKVFKARQPDERRLPRELQMQNRSPEPPHRGYERESAGPPLSSGPAINMKLACSENERANDCEIIVHDRSQRAYAEMIERNLKKMGLAVDLLFPNETIPILTLLSTIASRGTLYAISVSPQHELKASMTLNILHGEDPEEHRNMPIDKAIAMVGRDFERYVASGGKRQGEVTTASGLPEGIENMLNLLAQSKPLTVMQYEALIKFLALKREVQVKLELGNTQTIESKPVSLGVSAPSAGESQAEQLQKRIMSIMEQKLGKTEPPKPAAPIMDDPKVQKALSSLFSGSLF
ncbi:nuclear receptor coactivator 5-like [Neocloeon triangulifer]|uniref:nuclear receptor coactivator 5-like n=1 Tax=Neocloeon triangulifer TaxID=2078957 RepID=UPI00286EFAB3|nr:nuclear receptor coactivator 5-like [Neocloeon triangulifer]XP_059472009.1 nuclear receptor coactivator 5-like [Neocloeon triangulifer]